MADTPKMDVEVKEVIVGIVTDIDLLQHVAQKENSNQNGSSQDNSDGEN